MPRSNNEANILLALQAYRNDPKLSLRRAAKIYQVKYSTLFDRENGVTSRCDWIPKSRKLSDLEEQIIVQFILDLDSRGFPPRLRGVEGIANWLLCWAGEQAKPPPEVTDLEAGDPMEERSEGGQNSQDKIVRNGNWVAARQLAKKRSRYSGWSSEDNHNDIKNSIHRARNHGIRRRWFFYLCLDSLLSFYVRQPHRLWLSSP